MTTLADDVLNAMIAYENDRPRSQQVRLGPSELGGCREYVRNIMIGSPQQESHVWPTAAVMGTLVGSYMERVLQQYMGAMIEVPVTTKLPSGISVTGHADIVFVDRNAVADCKSKNGLDGVKKEGPSLENLVQVSVYTVGLVQQGILKPGASAHLLYVDRSGDDQTVYEVVLDWETIEGFIEKCEERLRDVIDAQDHIDAGEVEYARDLRDKTPPFCYSKKVLCPFRDMCWKGSEWVPSEEITDPEIIDVVRMYVENREMQNAAVTIRKDLKARLEGITGITPDGYAVTWPGSGNALYVTLVKAG